MAEIKICGVNDAAFAVAAERLGADYLGLIFAKGSPRQITPEEAKAIVAALKGRARVVGVFTDTPVAEIRTIAEQVGFGIVQLHRRAEAADIQALRQAGFEVWALAGGAVADTLIFDASHGDGETALRFGGWKTMLAGGIGPDTVADALRSGADIVDASGALEVAPGVKSIPKLETFMRRVAEARP
ncbi:MAG: phosphoribosylanthranilate isomerase [Kiritimatiellae bacterium]|nr:phosphoribosylanthranilate isomerase [Kiritimatiellia bacterium]